MKYRQYREMKELAKRTKGEITPLKMRKYWTTLTDCGCPDYQIRQRKIGGACKHMRALRYAHAIVKASAQAHRAHSSVA